jgi:hypothetical protein
MGLDKPTTPEDKEGKLKICDISEKWAKGEGQQLWFSRATALIYIGYLCIILWCLLMQEKY